MYAFGSLRRYWKGLFFNMKEVKAAVSNRLVCSVITTNDLLKCTPYFYLLMRQKLARTSRLLLNCTAYHST